MKTRICVLLRLLFLCALVQASQSSVQPLSLSSLSYPATATKSSAPETSGSSSDSRYITKIVDPASLVLPFIGTINGGHVFPGATLPHGMIKAGMDTDSPGNVRNLWTLLALY